MDLIDFTGKFGHLSGAVLGSLPGTLFAYYSIRPAKNRAGNEIPMVAADLPVTWTITQGGLPMPNHHQETPVILRRL